MHVSYADLKKSRNPLQVFPLSRTTTTTMAPSLPSIVESNGLYVQQAQVAIDADQPAWMTSLGGGGGFNTYLQFPISLTLN